VPSHFAVMRAGISGDGRAVNIRRSNPSSPLLITGYSLDFAPLVFNIDAQSCSAGGTRLSPRIVYAYTQDNPFGPSVHNLVPLPSAQILGTQMVAGYLFTRSATSVRQVADITSQTNVRVMVDAFARCRFGTDVQESPDPHWSGNDDGSFQFWGLTANGLNLYEGVSDPGGGVRFR
jgi:hypothetical protein